MSVAPVLDFFPLVSNRRKYCDILASCVPDLKSVYVSSQSPEIVKRNNINEGANATEVVRKREDITCSPSRSTGTSQDLLCTMFCPF